MGQERPTGCCGKAARESTILGYVHFGMCAREQVNLRPNRKYLFFPPRHIDIHKTHPRTHPQREICFL